MGCFLSLISENNRKIWFLEREKICMVNYSQILEFTWLSQEATKWYYFLNVKCSFLSRIVLGVWLFFWTGTEKVLISFVWYCVQFKRFSAIFLNWGRGEQAAQAAPPPELNKLNKKIFIWPKPWGKFPFLLCNLPRSFSNIRACRRQKNLI